MSYSKNDLIRRFPDANSREHYTCVVLEDNGRVLQVKPKGGVFKTLQAWYDSIPEPNNPKTHTKFNQPKEEPATTITHVENKNPAEVLLLEHSNSINKTIHNAISAIHQCKQKLYQRLTHKQYMKNDKEIVEQLQNDLRSYNLWTGILLQSVVREDEYKRRIKKNSW